MADKPQLTAQIRFALEQLSERNAQHDWEHLCRHLARSTICSNILPATGPVQAGGDQGRDFESFRTYLSKSALKDRSFVGLVSDKPLAFACTLEKKVETKVRGDVKTIMASGTKVERIYVFCAADVPTAKRHKLQEWVRATYDVELEILDGAAVSELLAQQEFFWIAERYLQLPAELIPSLPAGEGAQDWYTETLAKWQHESRQAQTYADFSEIHAAGRYALGPFGYDDDGRPIMGHERPELPFWIDRLDEIIAGDTLPSLQRKAFYEASVLRLRGLGDLFGQEDRLRLYFAGIPQLDDAADLEDAEALLTYVHTAAKLGHVLLSKSETTIWRADMERRLTARVRYAKEHQRVNEWCALLDVSGHSALVRHIDEGVIDFSEAFARWRKLAKLADRAPLFPLERFADRLAQQAGYLGAHPEYEPLTTKIDALLAKRHGQGKAAEKCLERAREFRKAGDLPRAMAQLHKAKIDWFAEETLGKSILAMNWLSHAYKEQGLFFAAKYYALAAAFVALQAKDLQLKPFIARSLMEAGECDYAMGAWQAFLDLAKASAIFYPHYAHDPTTEFNDPKSALQGLISYLTLVPVGTGRLHPALEVTAREQCAGVAKRLGFAEIMKDLQADLEGAWTKLKDDKLWAGVESDLAGPPWSDAGSIRRTQWRAHGVTWKVAWANDYETTLAAEAFLSALQIFLSDLAGEDLCVMRSTLNISIQLTPENIGATISSESGYKGFDTTFEPTNEERRAIVTLPSYGHFREGTLSRDDLTIGALGAVNSLLSEVSLLPIERFNRILDARFAHGLPHKLMVGAPYGQCLGEFVDQETFDEASRKERVPAPRADSFVSRRSDGLPWVDVPGPGYDPAHVRQQMRSRYEKSARPIGRTLQRLRVLPEFQATVARLRADGWKDWHILSAVFHVTMNYRLNQHPYNRMLPRDADVVADKMIRDAESLGAEPVPLEEYSEENLRRQMPMYSTAFAKTFGLELHQETPDFAALEDFLAHRYNFWIDDVEHDDPFAV